MTAADDLLCNEISRVERLISRYSSAVTRGDYEQVRSVFVSDAVWESPLLGMHFTTADDFVEYMAEGCKSFDLLVQTTHNPVVEILNETKASATTVVHEFFRGIATDDMFGAAGDPINVDMFGIYYDDITRIDGHWLFARRLYNPFLISTGTVTGDVVQQRPLTPMPLTAEPASDR